MIKKAVIIDNVDGEEDYPVPLMEVDRSHNVEIDACATKHELSYGGANKKLTQLLWPHLDKPNMEDVLHNAYNGDTHLMIGKDDYRALMEKSIGLENFYCR